MNQVIAGDLNDEMTVDGEDVSSEASKGDPGMVTALARGLDLLSCFKYGESTLSNIELALRCNLPKSTVSRLTQTLTKLGYLIHVRESGRYRLGTSCLALGSALLTRLDVRTIARPLMMELANATGASVSLCIPHKLVMIYLEHCRSIETLSLTLDVGSRIPVSTTAVGRAWLAFISPEQRAEVMLKLAEAAPESWGEVRSGIDKGLDDYRSIGITTSFGDWNKGVHSIARAFSPGHGLPEMAINLGGASYNLSPERLLEYCRPRLIEMVQNFELLLPRAPPY